MADGYTKSEILSRMLENIPEQYDKTAGTFICDELSAVAIQFEGMYASALSEFKRTLISTAAGSDLDCLLRDFGFYRKGSTKARGEVTFTGEVGAEISYGDIVANYYTKYNVIQNAVIGSDGTVTVPIECEYTGVIGNSVVDAVTIIPISIKNIYSVNNDKEITGGTSVETDKEFRNRFTEFYSHPSASGSVYDYQKWATSVDGVGYSKCIPIWNGGGTVKVIISDSKNKACSSELIAKVYDYIADKAPIGADVTVVTVTEVPVVICISNLQYDGSCDFGKIKLDITEYIDNYFSTLSLYDDKIEYFKIIKNIMQVNGIDSCGDISFKILDKEYKTDYQLSEYSVAVVSDLEVIDND